VQLSAREFQLLRYFVGHRGKTLSRAEILKEVWVTGRKRSHGRLTSM
jgi:DNA-binding response OmpR family regulator